MPPLPKPHLGGAPELVVLLPLAAIEPGSTLGVGDSLPGEGKHAGLAWPGSLHRGAGRAGGVTLPPVAAIPHVTPIAGGGGGAPGYGVRTLVLKHSTLISAPARPGQVTLQVLMVRKPQ